MKPGMNIYVVLYLSKQNDAPHSLKQLKMNTEQLTVSPSPHSPPPHTHTHSEAVHLSELQKKKDEFAPFEPHAPALPMKTASQ